MAWVGVGAVTVTSLALWLQHNGNDTAGPATATATSSAVATPYLNLPAPIPTAAPPTSVAVPPPDSGECRADKGDQNSGAGAIAAFNFAYYNQRSGPAARQLATPTSSVRPAEELQTFIDAVPPGTNYCLRTVAVANDIYLVDLSELRPGVPPSRITQTVTTKQIDGRWYVDTFK